MATRVRGVLRETQYQKLDEVEYLNVVRDLQARHERLLGRLGELGTMGSRTYTEVIRPLQAPYEFTRDSVTSFLFPPQYGLELYCNSGETTTDDEWPEIFMHEAYNWDSGQITTFLQIRYDDFNNPPYMGVSSIPAGEPIPLEIQTAIDEAFDSRP